MIDKTPPCQDVGGSSPFIESLGTKTQSRFSIVVMSSDRVFNSLCKFVTSEIGCVWILSAYSTTGVTLGGESGMMS